jgi:hypothetical protein
MAGGQGESRRAGAVRSACACCLLGLGLAGCSSANRVQQSDPLTGDQPPVPVAGAKGPAADAAKAGPAGPLPALPAPSSSTSTAALAAATVPRLDPGSGQRNGPPPEARLGAAPTDGADRSPAATLNRPQPVGGPAPVPVPRLQPISSSTTGGVADGTQWGALVKQLQDRGMKAFRLELERDTGLWRCTCSIPDRDKPSLKQTYDTRAADPAAALRAVLEEVERGSR